MRASRTFRPAVDGLEARNLLSHVSGPGGLDPFAAYLNGTVTGNWYMSNRLNPNAYQTQGFFSPGEEHVDSYSSNGSRDPNVYEVSVNPSSLVLPPLSKGGVVVGTLRLKLTSYDPTREHKYIAMVSLPVSGTVENATHDSFQIIQGDLKFPTTHPFLSKPIGGFAYGQGEIVYFTEKVKPDGKGGSFKLDFTAPRT
jgi:hypothetical protein